jgi:thiamine transport system permease protein
LLFLLLFFYLPVGTVLSKSFLTDAGPSTARYLQLLSDPLTWRIVGFTFVQALLSTLFSLALGLPGAYLIARFRFPGRGLLRSASAVPFVLPPILVVLGFVIFFGNNGFLNRALMGLFDLNNPPLQVLYSLAAIILAHGFYNFPIALRVVASLWSELPPESEWAAKTLGARGARLFFTVTLPQLLPAILASAALIFMFCFTSFAVILVLGGGPAHTTVEVEIYRLARTAFRPAEASALASVALVLTLGITYLYIKLQNRFTYRQELSSARSRHLPRRLPGPAASAALIVYGLFVLLVVAGPLLSIAIRSLQQPTSWAGAHEFTLHWYRQIFGAGEGGFAATAVTAIKNSVAIGVLAAVIAVPLGASVSYLTSRYHFRGRRFLDTLMMAPLGISSVVLGLGYLLLTGIFPGWLRGSPLTVVFAHAVIAYPFVVRAVSPVLSKIGPNRLRAAMVLGSPPGRVFRDIELPILTPALLAGASFAFAISIGEINATIMLGGQVTTIPIAIYRLIGAYNFFGACALGTVLIAVCAGVFYLFDLYGDTGI